MVRPSLPNPPNLKSMQLVELKTGDTFNGHMVACDNFMNVTMQDVYQTSEDGTRFWKMKDAYLRGNNIKYIRVADAVRFPWV
jgi:U6 snRNA-associated Sm-like protein LSm4